jgi:hypothetical protein
MSQSGKTRLADLPPSSITLGLISCAQASRILRAVIGPPVKLMHRGHEHELRARMVCANCGEAVDARSGEVVANPDALRERAAMARGDAC